MGGGSLQWLESVNFGRNSTDAENFNVASETSWEEKKPIPSPTPSSLTKLFAKFERGQEASQMTCPEALGPLPSPPQNPCT